MSLKKNVLANFLGNGWSAFMSLAFIPLQIRYLGMEAYGLIGFYAVLQTSLLLLDAGLTPALSREMARYKAGLHSSRSIRDLLRTLEIIAFILAVIFTIFVWQSSSFLANRWLQVKNLEIETVVQAFSIMGLVTALRFIEGLYRGAVLGLQIQVKYNLINSIAVTLRNVGAIAVLALISSTITAYFYWQAFVSTVSLLALACLTYKELPPSESNAAFSIAELIKVKEFATGIFFTTLLVLLLTQADKLILSRILTLESFGNYNLAATVANSLLMLVGPITQAFYPQLTEMISSGKQENAARIFHKGSQIISVLVGTAACMLLFFGEGILTAWTRNQALSHEISPIVKILAIGSMLNSFMNMPYMLQLACGWSSFAAKVNLIAVAILIPTIIIVTPVYGSKGAAMVWLILNAGYVFIASHFMFRKILSSEKKAWFFNDLFMPLVFTVPALFGLSLIINQIQNTYVRLFYIMLAALIGMLISFFSANQLRSVIKKNLDARASPD